MVKINKHGSRVAGLILGLLVSHANAGEAQGISQSSGTSGLTAEAQYEGFIVKTRAGFRSAKSFLTRTHDIKETFGNNNQYMVVTTKPGVRAALALDTLKMMPNVEYIQKNHVVTRRGGDTGFEPSPTEPVPYGPVTNDEFYSELWQHNVMKTPMAWSMTTGGKTLSGRDVVVAIIDEGVDYRHPDLKENIWVNAFEIAGNKIDDDGNGYVDDVYGYVHPGAQAGKFGRHGTHIAGIIGGQGNNGIGIVGVNWNVKIMSVDMYTNSTNKLTSDVVRAYTYVIKQKQLWLDTKGEKGANVVVTNSSFGVDNAKCMSGDFPIWNDLYNQMGKLGILSAAATANNAVDVDVVGDVPTACDSPFIVAVTNTDVTDGLYQSAAWGLTHVDLAAPGTNICSSTVVDLKGGWGTKFCPKKPTNSNGGYEWMTGTSMATPQVAGTVALLYAAASPDFLALTESDPAAAALKLKEIMISTVDVIQAVNGKSVSNGRLNVERAASAVRNFKVQ